MQWKFTNQSFLLVRNQSVSSHDLFSFRKINKVIIILLFIKVKLQILQSREADLAGLTGKKRKAMKYLIKKERYKRKIIVC